MGLSCRCTDYRVKIEDGAAGANLKECAQRSVQGRSHWLRLQAILLKAPSNPTINMTGDVVIYCLMVYLGGLTDQLLRV
ncbi:unnamed protein product [Pleuronectes platessa]|uniref:Uncharacterized protein n=1 Tax=Pleuronectes platessa TaxID=8262 RepID=A0A9N7VBJ4_PLEPL|nr:unnamed protein product [Pleuronectes platessa]